MYTSALDIAPETSSHPFWQMTDLRTKSLQAWQAENLQKEDNGPVPYWQRAISSLETDIHQASKFVALSRWTNETTARQPDS